MAQSAQLQLVFDARVSPSIPTGKPCANDRADVTGYVCPDSEPVRLPANNLPKTYAERPTWEPPRNGRRERVCWAECPNCFWWFVGRAAEQERGKRKFCSHRCAMDFFAATQRFRGERNPHWKGGVSNDNMRYRRRQAEKWPEREAARRAVGRAVRNGTLIRLPCSICGSERSNGHHTDYSKQLDVVWLCRPCHDAEHARLKAAAKKPAKPKPATPTGQTFEWRGKLRSW